MVIWIMRLRSVHLYNCWLNLDHVPKIQTNLTRHPSNLTAYIHYRTLAPKRHSVSLFEYLTELKEDTQLICGVINIVCGIVQHSPVLQSKHPWKTWGLWSTLLTCRFNAYSLCSWLSVADWSLVLLLKALHESRVIMPQTFSCGERSMLKMFILAIAKNPPNMELLKEYQQPQNTPEKCQNTIEPTSHK